ncbi:hypothetical protein ElyMa_002347100 [Elysia marginata]|uniref:Reverse transcriptase zinc-binding domain-containing protein n=1 Tax=Elysia marginata TaxID=1093978 RepID=A0AAV4G9K5_9GAST|nr:hypothetical protein ElyMa_002347100 [Elysia marginata]
MDRKGQTTLFRLWTGLNRLKAPLYKTHKICHNNLCSCGEAAETVEHVLQDCQNYRMHRQAVWSSPTDLQTKFWGTIEELEKTNSFIHQRMVTNLSPREGQEADYINIILIL